MPESREMTERHLALAERHVDEGDGHIARQVEILAELERDGHVKAAQTARQLLVTFEPRRERTWTIGTGFVSCLRPLAELSALAQIGNEGLTTRVAKKRISGHDLSWIISEHLSDLRSVSTRISLAVVPDERDGWRVIVGNRDRGHLTAVDEQRLADIQRELRLVCELESLS